MHESIKMAKTNTLESIVRTLKKQQNTFIEWCHRWRVLNETICDIENELAKRENENVKFTNRFANIR